MSGNETTFTVGVSSATPVMIAAAIIRMECQMAARALICMLLLAVAGSAAAAGPNGAQQRGAEAFLAALAGGNVMAVAQELHPDEVEKLRTRLLTLFLGD